MGRKQIEHSEIVQEIMGTIPSWITRWGILVIFSIFMLVFLGCCFIRYPQTISAEVFITSSTPPSRLSSKCFGILDSIAVRNGQDVYRGDLLALFYTPAKYADILEVRTFLDQAYLLPIDSVLALHYLEQPYHLGELQHTWDEILSIAEEYKEIQSEDINCKKNEFWGEQIKTGIEYIELLLNSSEYLKLDKDLFLKDSMLIVHKMMLESEYEYDSHLYLTQQANMMELRTTLKYAETILFQLKQAVNKLDYQRKNNTGYYNLRMRSTLRRMRSEIDSWLDKYAIFTQVDGNVSMHNFWSKGQYANIGDIIATVVPINRDSIHCRIKLPSLGVGKIKEGQEVKIQVNGFPYMEYGILNARVSKISQVPEKDSFDNVYYLVEAIFPDGLISTYGVEFPLIHEMDGTAQIITADMKLIDYFLKPIRSVIRNL